MVTTSIPLTVRVPSEADFGEDGDEFLDDPILDGLLMEVVGSYDRLRHIEDHGISVHALWKKKGGKSKGALTYGKCIKPSGLLAHFCTVDFVIWLAADNVELEGWTTVQIRKLLYHEARHIEWDEGDDTHDPKAVLKGHDLELHLGELHDTGAWERTRDALAAETMRPEFVVRSKER